MKLRWSLVVVGLAVAGSTCFAEEPAVQRAGIYSDLYYNQEAGDLLGAELMLIPSGNGQYMGFLQIADGDLPFTALIPVTTMGASIAFRVTTDPDLANLRFNGRFTDHGIEGRWTVGGKPMEYSFRGDGDTEHLTKGKSYWQ